jgi:hypothetical protein
MSLIFSFARSSREGVTSIASIVGERSTAMTSGAVSSTKGGVSRCQAGPAAARLARASAAASSHEGADAGALSPLDHQAVEKMRFDQAFPLAAHIA